MTHDVALFPILVADDNPNDVFFLRRRLVSAGIHFPVQHVEDGMEAINWLERFALPGVPVLLRPWLIFLDLKMPRKDGFGVLEWMKEKGLTETTTVCVLSTLDEPADKNRAKALGAHRFLTKYPRPADLIELAALASTRSTGAPSPEAGSSVPIVGV